MTIRWDDMIGDMIRKSSLTDEINCALQDLFKELMSKRSHFFWQLRVNLKPGAALVQRKARDIYLMEVWKVKCSKARLPDRER